MRALTLIDDNAKNPMPWLSLMEGGIKTDETRTWPIPRENNPVPFDLLLCGSASSRTKNKSMAACVVEVYGCSSFAHQHVKDACCDLYPGFAWHTRKLRWLSRKFYVKGTMGIFQVDIPNDVTLYTPTYDQIQYFRRGLFTNYPNMDLPQ